MCEEWYPTVTDTGYASLIYDRPPRKFKKKQPIGFAPPRPKPKASKKK